MHDKEKQKRRRVPVSCLVCKKRKVKCDKTKPACGGCVRNGAAHLCEYVEAPWSKGMGEARAPPSVAVEDTPEYTDLVRRTDAVIAAHQHEIAQLKHQLSMAGSVALPHVPSAPPSALPGQPLPRMPEPLPDGRLARAASLPNVPSVGAATSSEPPVLALAVLNKLRPLSAKSRDVFEVSAHHQLLVFPVNYKKYFVDVFSWMNVVKMDPKLTHMWLKLANLQKIYHLYKMNRLKGGGLQGAIQMGESSSFSSLGSSSQGSQPPTLAKPTPSKCPVLDTGDLALMDDLSNTPSKRGTPAVKEEATAEVPPSDVVSGISQVQERLHTVWSSMVTLGTQKISDKQLYFLMEFYFNNPVHAFESRDVLRFYRSEIISTIRVKHGTVMFDCSGLMGAPQDESMLHALQVKAVYIAMLTMIVDASLEFLGQHAARNPHSPLASQYHAHFGVHGVGFKPATDLTGLFDGAVHYYASHAQGPVLGFLAATVAWINREITHGPVARPQGAHTRFTAVFTGFLRLVLREDAAIAVWKDPRMVQFAPGAAGGTRTNDELRVHLSDVWAEMVRLANLVNFRVMPLIAGSDDVDALVGRIYTKIEEAEASRCHLAYLEAHAAEGHAALDLRIHYLIARVFYTITRGITTLNQPRLTTAHALELVAEADALVADSAFQSMARRSRHFEATAILSYTSMLLGYLVLLQGEDAASAELLAAVVPDVLARGHRLVRFLRSAVADAAESMSLRYVVAASAEVALRFIQLQFGFLIRVSPDDKDVGLTRDAMGTAGRHDVEAISSGVDALLAALADAAAEDTDKVANMKKMWSFYVTFSSSTINYAKIHANLPEFATKSGSQACPVLVKRSDSAKDVSSQAASFRKCPISHITTPVDDNPETPKISGVLAHQSLAAVRDREAASRKRKCPFDHSALTGHSSGGRYGYNPLESNIRGGADTAAAIPRHAAPSLMAQAQLPPSAALSQSFIESSKLPHALESPGPELRPDVIDFGFDLDFDTLQMDVFNQMNMVAPEFEVSFEEPFEQPAI
ncbi:hypothetical protein DICA1_F07558 [Diutina catenulata]